MSYKDQYGKRGYLNEDFLFFYLKDSKGEQFEYHYHEFYKIIIFISGKVTYLIEGKAYILKPWDILLITDKDIHKALIETSEPYERYIIWLNPKFLEKNSCSNNNLLTCFEHHFNYKENLLSLSPDDKVTIKNNLLQLENCCKNQLFGTSIEKNLLFLLFIINLNRIFIYTDRSFCALKIQFDETVNKIINYINTNINCNLTIEELSKKFYISKYTLMHKFKKQTGFTVHQFILQKRLIAASNLIKTGGSLSEISYECGFTDYSGFVRAFKRFYGLSPKQL